MRTEAGEDREQEGGKERGIEGVRDIHGGLFCRSLVICVVLVRFEGGREGRRDGREGRRERGTEREGRGKGGKEGGREGRRGIQVSLCRKSRVDACSSCGQGAPASADVDWTDEELDRQTRYFQV